MIRIPGTSVSPCDNPFMISSDVNHFGVSCLSCRPTMSATRYYNSIPVIIYPYVIDIHVRPAPPTPSPDSEPDSAPGLA